jgi:GGDEF domain-containing protein
MIEAPVERDYFSELSSSVSCYLSLLAAVGECVGAASPEVGGPYRKRIEQLRTRLFYQASPRELHNSVKVVEGELSDYAVVAAQCLSQHDLELRRVIVELDRVIDTLATQYDLHQMQLEKVAAGLEGMGPVAQMSAEDAAGELRRSAENVKRETASMLDAMHKEIAEVDSRLRGNQSTDPSTGLLNAREIKRQMEAYTASGLTFSILRFELYGQITEPVMKKAAGRLEQQFRHRDRIARWGEAQFLVLFQGPARVAESRADQVAKILGGRYELATGGEVEIFANAQLEDPQVALH